MTNKELKEFMYLHGISMKELSEILGVTIAAVSYWLSGDRTITPIVTKLIRMFKKYPQLIREF